MDRLEAVPLGPRTMVPAALGLLFTYLAVSTFLTWYRLRKFKGPLSAALSYFWLANANYSGRALDYYMGAREKYGKTPLLRVGPDTLMTDDPDVVRQMNTARNGYDRSQWYDSFRLDPYVHNMFSTRDLSYHDDIKARTSAGYSGREVPNLEGDVNEQVNRIKNLIREKHLSSPGGTKPTDFTLLAQLFTLDSLSTIAYGEPFGFIAANEDLNGFVRKARATFPFVTLCSMVPLMNRFFFSTFWLSIAGPSKTDGYGFGMLMATAAKVVAPRFTDAKTPNPKEDKQDMLGAFVRHGLDKRQCEAEALLQILAGSDSTGNAIRSLMLTLVSSPQVYTRLQKEIDEASAKDAISSPITLAEARSLPYLQAVIYESLRYHPPLIGVNTKVVPKGGDTLAGQFVPGGTNIAVNPWALMRHVPTFGEDVDVFRPDRWLDASPDRYLNMQRNAELVFGHGRFMCAGKNVAFMELNKMAVELLRDFDFQLINLLKPCEEVLYTHFLMENLWLRVTARTR
ncbi:Uu.00g024500.m01.CDS01 [Anthostomella pinea]|uniref:Uu.00g024500.m01.CDS01 n=1 Tax=Anthostomella pinea TaxID=933095 RepID=A0AAI8YR74_9PEZI|nr:Uu.00g024500.m01.CDS01 [Anthostomella pinea]